jgi:hypothetical protein
MSIESALVDNQAGIRKSGRSLLETDAATLPLQKWSRFSAAPDVLDIFGTLTIAGEKKPPARKIKIEGSEGRQAEIEFDDGGRPKRYVAADGETFERQKDNPEIWLSRTNVVQTQGVKLDFEESSKKVTITDIESGNKVEIAGTLETTTYNPCGGKVIKQMRDGSEWLALHDASGTLRTMQIENNKLVNYTDGQGNTYTRTEKVTDEKPGEKYSGGFPLFSKTDSQGNSVAGQYTVSADRAGNVCVRNETVTADGTDERGSAQYARRERIDGVVITSNFDNSKRELTKADLKIASERLVKDDGSKELLSKKITSAGGVVTIKYEEGRIESLSGFVAGEQIDYVRSKIYSDYLVNQLDQTLSTAISEKNGAIEIKLAGSSDIILFADGKRSLTTTSTLDLANDLESSPRVIQKTPAGVDLAANIEQGRQHSVSYSNAWNMQENGQWLNKQVDYYQPWDFKSPGKLELNMTEYEAFGNWHVGAVGGAADFDLQTLQEEAGAAQIGRGTSRPEWGNPGIGPRGFRLMGTYPFGDDPRDAELIEQGHRWYQASNNTVNNQL